MDEAGRPGLACVALRDERDGVAGSAAGTSIRSLFNRAFMFLISSNFAAIVAANASAIAALLSACASAIEADAAVSLVAFSPETGKYPGGMLGDLSSWSLEPSRLRFPFFAGGDKNGEEFEYFFTATNGNITNIINFNSTICGFWEALHLTEINCEMST